MLKSLLITVRKIRQRTANGQCVHTAVLRPWGSYTVLNAGVGFKVKLVQVEPYKRLSLQRHAYRSEHWVVVEGLAKVTNGDTERYQRPNESIFIPQGQIHRLENPAGTALKLIEVQCGDYLGEDDIERLDDDYHRQTHLEISLPRQSQVMANETLR